MRAANAATVALPATNATSVNPSMGNPFSSVREYACRNAASPVPPDRTGSARLGAGTCPPPDADHA
ncbi:hypothetical protein GCM10010515_41710 [Streptomyces fructofermentans]|uniref:Uncharacterized protein n=1 Tax=Streptomyces fructofermentans TaxID=152141 RepID=A0A918KQN1_9ACTN|nr:hypothetical protein GCM10010515_41710 [Streptomyces fructofermentans]